MEKKEKQAAVAVLIVVILFSSTIVILSSQNNTVYHKAPPKPLDRTIIFPRDEGSHDEPTENWILFMNISARNRDFFVWVSWSRSFYDPTNSTVILSVVDPTNYSGKIYNSETYISKNYRYSRNWSNLIFSSGDDQFDFKSADNETHKYILSTHSEIEDKPCNMEMLFENMRTPALFTQQYGNSLRYGSLYFGNGTMFGYLQSRFSITGSFSLNGKEWVVSGKGGLLHSWGGASVEIFEFLYGQYKDKDLLSISYYAPGGERLALEQLYIIYKDRYNLYSSVEGHSIGASIWNNTYTDLEGENYSLYPTSYVLDPTDPTHSRVYAFNWSISTTYDSLNVTVNPLTRRQFPSRIPLEGAVYIKEDGKISGWGFIAENKRYLSSPYVSGLRAEKNKEGNTWNLIVYAYAQDTIPIDKMVLHYNSSEREGQVLMKWDGDNDVWGVSIGGFSDGDKVSYYVTLVNCAGGEYSTEPKDITF